MSMRKALPGKRAKSFIEALEARRFLTAVPFQVSDIFPGSSSSNPSAITASANSVYFVASPMTDDQQLFVSNGTPNGTVQLTSVNDAGGANPYALTNVNGTLFFAASDPTNGTELWKSNGTVGGTALLKDIYAGSGALGPNSSNPHGFVAFQNELYFVADDGNGEQIWKSDGTAANTTPVTSINPGTPTSFDDLVVQGNQLYFFGDDAVHGPALWKSDGTGAGTTMVQTTGTTPGGGGVGQLTPAAGQLFFVAFDPTNGYQVWRSDGTPGGTHPVKIIDPGIIDVSDGPQYLTTIGNNAYFSAMDNNGRQLWISDGTDAGTMVLKDIHPGFAANPTSLTNVNGTLYFAAEEDTDGVELWKSDGTTGGTTVVTNINAGAASSNPSGLINVNGVLYFNADDGTHGFQLFQSDGTPGGTQPVAVINPTGDAFDNNGGHNRMATANGLLYFDATDGTNGQELWAYQAFTPLLTASTTTVVSSQNSADSGIDVQFTATVADTGGVIPTGNVTFFDGNATLGTGALDDTGVATFSTSSLAVGDHSITAQYAGDGAYSPSTSPAFTQTITTPSASLVPDLSGSGGSLPGNVVAGAKFVKFVPVVVSNPTDAAVKGPVIVTLYATMDPSSITGAAMIGTLTHRVILNPQKLLKLKIKVSQFPLSLPEGNYSVVAQLTDPVGLTRIAVLPGSVQVAAPFIKPVAALGAVTPNSIAAGKHAFVTLIVNNQGNTIATGVMSIEIDPSTDGQTAIAGLPLLATSKRVTIKPGASAKLRLRLTVASGLAAAQYIPLVTVMLNGVPGSAAGTAFMVT